ncbi:MAG TPA: hypothetical protein VN962_03650, partial [Polyangia bacterium]|nr:hypothetical protein [Polyangia bacterium]
MTKRSGKTNGETSDREHATGQPRHGRIRGLDRIVVSAAPGGRFGRMFPALPPAEFDAPMLKDLAVAMSADPDDETPEDQIDPEENAGISAGYTYFGQFIDHDLSFDPASSLQQQNDPDALEDYRTPRFDLDCVYARGPDDQPYLYERDGSRTLMLLGPPLREFSPSLPRGPAGADGVARALIGDPRNDENVIVGQLHAAVIGFHNKLAQELYPNASFS